MNTHGGAHLNLVMAWGGIVLGFVSGFVLGLCFHREDWLGGYTSLKRRLYRLAHISFFGLALMNFVFYLTTREFAQFSQLARIASWGFVAGAVSMPICCIVMAHQPRWRALFLVPVVSLTAGGLLTLLEVIKL
jgi:hypothetical protein